MIDYILFRTKLSDERERLLTDLSSIATRNDVSGDWEAIPNTQELQESDENNEADGVEEWNERRATVAALEVTYRNIDRALQKIADKTYGVCEICGEAIADGRLEILPAARTCMTHINDEETLSL
jgi:DnaK suppressor protein